MMQRALVFIGMFGGLSALGLTANLADPADTGWHYAKVDPKTKIKLVVIDAKKCVRTDHPYVFKLQEGTGSFYERSTSSYSNVKFKTAFLDERSGTLFSGNDVMMMSLR